MLSRVANSIYWMSRYAERAENVARFLDVNQNMTLGDASLGGQWAPMVYTTGDQKLFEEHYGDPSRANVLRFLAFDQENPNSILSCVATARENARTVREVISTPMWEQLNKFHLMVQSASRSPASLHMVQDFCERVRLANHTLIGQTYATMSRGEAWHFSNIGRFLERADKTSRIVDVQYYLLLPDLKDVGSSLDVVRWSRPLEKRLGPGDVPPGAWSDYAVESRRLSPAKPDFPALDSFLPGSGRRIPQADHRQRHRHLQVPWRTTDGSHAGRPGLSSDRRHYRKRNARIH